MKPADFARLLLLAAIWGASFLFMRLTAPVLGGIRTAFFRVFFGTVGLAGILLLIRFRPVFGKHLPATLLLGIINSGIPLLMFALAARVLPAGYSAIFNATTPLMGVLFGGLFFGDRFDERKILGVIAGLAGVALLTFSGPIALTPSTALGAMACLLATSCYGLGGFLTKRWIVDRGGLDARTVALGSLIGATLFLLPFFGTSMVAAPGTIDSATPSLDIWLALCALGLLCTAWAYILYFRLVADIGPIRTLTVTFLIPPFGVVWGALFLQEKVTWAHLAGGALIILALYFVLLRPKSTLIRGMTDSPS